MKRALWFACVLLCGALPAQAIVAPRNGGALPPAYFEVKSGDRNAFAMSYAWIEKTRRIRARRERFLRENGSSGLNPVPVGLGVTGTLTIPVLLVQYSNRPVTTPIADIRRYIFDGPIADGTLPEYFTEVSYGALSVTGAVYDWSVVPHTDFYYEGSSNGLLPGDARTGELIRDVVVANDSSIDFGDFDNDGPDGVPNSGDDDGRVDFIVIIPNEKGGECGATPNIWSHAWDYRAWPVSGGQSFTTDDVSANGGFIQITDYVILPSRSCGGGIVRIGLFCHEFLHAFGVPDLFDPAGGSGIGDWGLMGTGYMNMPHRPAHPCAWTKQELGWLVPQDVTWQEALESIPDVETNPVAFRLSFTDGFFVRMAQCALSDSFSMRCGADSELAAARNWGVPGGYGNNWNEVIEKEFTYDGTTPVTFSYQYLHDLEANFDSVVVSIEVGGSETVLTTYTGIGAGTEVLDLSPVLSPLPADTSYVVRFRVVTDFTGSDEDSTYLSNCGAFVVDVISLSGGGENYSTGFETSVDGWHGGLSGPEYWLVENRQAVGFDTNVHNTGLVIMHADDRILHSRTGNSEDSPVRGLVVEEADGIGHLLQDPLTTGNTGDAGDPWPGSTTNTAFHSSSTPNSNSNSGQPTKISITGIGVSGTPMSAMMVAGDPAPMCDTVAPDALDNDQTSVLLTATGSNFRAGSTFHLQKSGEADIMPLAVFWHDPSRLDGEFNIYSVAEGYWDVVCTNPDGQETMLPAAVQLVEKVPTLLVSADVHVRDYGVEISFELYSDVAIELPRVSRANKEAGSWVLLDALPVEVRPAVYNFVDSDVAAGRKYYYRVSVKTVEGAVFELYRTSVIIPSRETVLDQNYPNPFNPNTTISYYVPKTTKVRLDIYMVNGALVRTLVSGVASEGSHEHLWDGRDNAGNVVSTGVYLYRLYAGSKVLTRKMLFVK